MYLPDTHLVHHRSMDNIGTWRKNRGYGWEQPKSVSPTHPKSVKEPDEGGSSREVPVPHRHQYRFGGKIDLVYVQSQALGGPVPMGAPRLENGRWHYNCDSVVVQIL